MIPMIATPPRPEAPTTRRSMTPGAAPSSSNPATTAERIANLRSGTGKRHAAKGSRAVALGLSLTSSFGLAGGLYYADHASATTSTATRATSNSIVSTRVAATAAATLPAATAVAGAAISIDDSGTDGTTAATTGAPAATAAKSTVISSAPIVGSAPVAATNGLASGTFDGSTIDTRYGPVQVEVNVANGQITTVTVLVSPDGDRKSVQINSRAVPALNSETIKAQSASIDTVSGATYTSDAYVQSLQSALDQARIK